MSEKKVTAQEVRDAAALATYLKDADLLKQVVSDGEEVLGEEGTSAALQGAKRMADAHK